MMQNTTLDNSKKSMLTPFIAMVVIMALIGLITSLYQQFQVPIKEAFLAGAGELKNTLSTVLTFSLFLAYFSVGPLAARILNNKGYKYTLLLGVVILSISLFFLAAIVWSYQEYQFVFSYGQSESIPLSYFLFVIASFLSGAGLTFIQSVANPYLLACEVPHTSRVQRQTIGGTANSLATTLTPLLLASLVFSSSIENKVNIDAVLTPISLLAIFVLVLYFGLSRFNLPEVQTEDKKIGHKLEHSVWQISHLSKGVVAIFFYVGVEVCVGANINQYAIDDLGFLPTKAAMLATLYWLGLLVGRFCGSFINNISDRNQLLFTSIIAMLLLLLSMLTKNPYFLVLIGLCHSVMWPAIFALATDRLGIYTAKGSGALMMGVVGGGILPLIQGFSADLLGSWQFTWGLVFLGEVYLLYYAISGSRIRTSFLETK